MDGNFGFSEPKCNDKVSDQTENWEFGMKNVRGRGIIIPLQSKGVASDNPLLAMSFPQISQIRFQLLLFLIVIGFTPAMAADSEKEKAPESIKESADKQQTDGEEPKEGVEEKSKKDEVEIDEETAAEEADADAVAAAKALPVSPDPVQIYGWREKILIDGLEKPFNAKLDTGAYTSSIHAEEKELFERDGKKWVRFTVTEPRKKNSPRVQLEAPLVRIARIKEPGGESETREVVKLAFKIGDRKLRGDFTLNNRSNMLSPVLIGRMAIRELGWIDPSRTNLADDKIMR